MKRKLTLYVDDKVTERAKVQAVLERRPLSVIVEELLEKYLDSLAKTRGKVKS